jgi:hypothetical protein
LPPFALFANQTYNIRASVSNERTQEQDTVQLQYEQMYNQKRNAIMPLEMH